MRNKLWRFIQRNYPEGVELSGWRRTIKAILFPLKYTCWKVGKTHGYQWDYDDWIIGGVRYNDYLFDILSKARGEIYKITNEGGRCIFERIR